jgi:hypothetical protein
MRVEFEHLELLDSFFKERTVGKIQIFFTLKASVFDTFEYHTCFLVEILVILPYDQRLEEKPNSMREVKRG